MNLAGTHVLLYMKSKRPEQQVESGVIKSTKMFSEVVCVFLFFLQCIMLSGTPYFDILWAFYGL